MVEATQTQESRESGEYGGVAQLGEHLPCTQGVRSSNLLISTTGRPSRPKHRSFNYGLIAQVVRARA